MQSAFIAWTHLAGSFTLQVFTVSTILLLTGLTLKVWQGTVSLKFLTLTPLKDIEMQHPYVPSLRTIVGIFLCSAALLAVVLQTVSGLPPLSGPYDWIVLAAFFLLGTTAGILGELHWPGTRDYVFSVTVGTAIAFLFLVFKFALPIAQPIRAIALLALLCFSTLLAHRILYRSSAGAARALGLLTFILWILVYFR